MNDTRSVSDEPPALDTWKQAVINHTNTLSPAQQLQFKAPATVDDCLRILKEHQAQKNAFTRILRFVEPLIDTLKRFEGAIDVVVQVNTGIGSPIWGPLRLAVTIASDHFRTLERLALVIDKIASSVRRYHDFENLFKSHDDVRNTIGTLYSDLICFCTRIVRFHTRSFRYVFTTFEKEFGPIWESIEFHSNEVHRAASLAHMKDEKGARDRMEADKQMEMAHRLQRWLSPSTVEDDLHKHLAEHMDNSSDWVTTSTEFVSWLHGQSNESFQIFGQPGSGKSTLAAFLVHYLSRIRSTVLYFFCDSSDGEKRETIYVLRTLLAQLLKANPSVQSDILPLYHQSGRAIADSSQVVSDAFNTIMRKQQGNDIYIIIDAIDECRDAKIGRWGLLRNLKSSTKDTKAKFILTTRFHGCPVTLQPNFRTTYAMSIKSEHSSRYLHEYVRCRIQNIEPIANTEFAHQVTDQIAEAADGLWLYARLMVNEIERAPSIELVRRRLDSLPTGLSDLYLQVLQSCEEKMTDDQQEFAKHLYIWLDVSDYMPSFWARSFDRLPYRILQLIFRYVNGGGHVFDAASLAQTLGAPLVELLPTGSTYELQFVHTTAYKYLAKSSEQPYDKLPAVLKPQRLNKLYRAMVAVWYFTECSDSERQLECLKDPSKFEEYFGSDAIGSYFEMGYGLINVFELRPLPLDISPEEEEVAKVISRRLSTFLQSDQILRYFEMSTIINYSGNYFQLLENVLRALRNMDGQMMPIKPIEEFNKCRKLAEGFFLTWAYVLYKTTPWRSQGLEYLAATAEHEWFPTMEKSGNSDKSLLVREMMKIGERWGNAFFRGKGTMVLQQVLNIDAADPDSQTDIAVCRRCARGFSGVHTSKHCAMACRAVPAGLRSQNLRKTLEASSLN